MNIPDKAVEAAAKTFYESQSGGDDLDTSWYRKSWINMAHEALEGAAPHIAEQALSEMADFLEREALAHRGTPLADGISFSARRLRDMADDMGDK